MKIVLVDFSEHLELTFHNSVWNYVNTTRDIFLTLILEMKEENRVQGCIVYRSS